MLITKFIPILPQHPRFSVNEKDKKYKIHGDIM